VRFGHTGEAGGVIGETVAAVASLGAAFLVWTGLSLALRRLRAARERQAKRGLPPAGDRHEKLIISN
jgi:threonine/homoserine/homoserine lactone efflux protein